MQELKKKHKEILALYKLEPDIKDIYVEGNTDKALFETFLANKQILKRVIPIEIVDFSELPIDYFEHLDIKSNKTKVIILSKLIQENIPSAKVSCIVDKDFDDFINSISNSKLLKTDYSCLESYLFCDITIEKFLRIGIGNFPYNSQHLLNQISPILKSIFCIRLIREVNYRSAQLVSFDNNLSVNKQNGIINFSEEQYLLKFIHKNNLYKEKEKIEKQYSDLIAKLNKDTRHYMNGHDFVEILYFYINCIKNTSKFKIENFGKSLFLAVESPMLETYPLFKSLIV